MPGVVVVPRLRLVNVRPGGEGDRGGSAGSRSIDGGENAAVRRVGEGDRSSRGGVEVVAGSEGKAGGGKKEGSVCRL